MPKKPAQSDELQAKIDELTLDLQRTRADFENYRKRSELEKEQSRATGKVQAIMKLLPVIDTIERAISHLPAELEDNTWAQGVASLVKQLEKSLEGLSLARIDASKGAAFNPELHEAIQMDEQAEGDHEVIAEELQSGYTMDGVVLRHSMVKVTKR